MWKISGIIFVFLHLSVSLLNFVTEIQQQENIIHTTTTLSQARHSFKAASSGVLVFFAGGKYTLNGLSDRVDIYNVTSGSWTTATLSIPRAELAATSSQNLVFFGGGWDANIKAGFYDRVDIYNTLNGSWSTATLSQPRCCLEATSVGNLVLFGGGDNSTGLSNVVDVFDVTNNTWTAATLSQARSNLAVTSVDNRYALFGGGRSGFSPSNVVDIFDLLSGMWNTTALSQARSGLASTSLGNLAFFGGGSTNDTQPSNVVDIFNSTSQTWSTSILSQARYGLSASSIGEIVAFGGGQTGSTFYSVVDMLNVTSNTWFTVTLSQPRDELASTSSTNRIFFGGGQNSSSSGRYSDVVDIFCFGVNCPLFPPTNPTTITSSTTSPQPLSSNTSPILTNTTISSSLSQSTSLSPNFNTSSNDQNTNNNEINNETLLIGVLISIGGVLIVGGIILLIVLILRKKRKNEKNKKIKQNEQCSTIQQTSETSNTITLTELLTKSSATTQKSQIPFNELIIEKKIGIGGYGEIWLGKWNSALVALKFCKNKGEIEDFMREIKLMIELPSHPNVVQMFGVSLDGPQPVIILEYCAGGSLDKLLFNSNAKLSEEHKIRLIRGIAAGMLHLHKHNIVHRDLAARNILLTASGDPKISDFGMSRILEKAEEGTTKSGVGPVCWMAPESIAHRNYSKKSDVWTFGIVVYEIVAQCEPHKDKDIIDVAVKIRDEGLTPEIPSNCPQKLVELMQMCWKKQPQQRPDFETICAMLNDLKETFSVSKI